MKKYYVLFILCLLPLFAQAVVNIDGIYYDLGWDRAKVTNKIGGYGDKKDMSNSYSGVVNIPENFYYYGTYTVDAIGDYAFYICNNLTSVTIPESVTEIGNFAFYACTKLTSAAIPNGVNYIGESAFCGCEKLTSVTIPSGVTYINKAAFTGCMGLTSVTIPNSVTEIGEWAFGSCSGLTSVTIPNSVTLIDYMAFQNCSGLTSVTIGKNVTSIGEWAFKGCSSLTSVTALMPTPVRITEETFTNRTNATLYVPKGSKSLYENANYWKEFQNIVEIDLDKQISFADENVKALCVKNWDTDQDGELSYEEAEAVTDLGEVFTNKSYITSFGELQYFTGLTSIGEKAFYACKGLTSVTIPNSVTSIGDKAFTSCNGLTSFTIPNSVTSIGESAFYGCSSLTSVTLPNSVTDLGKYSFSTSGLTSLTIGKGVTSISEYAFSYCTSLTSLTIPGSVTSIGKGAFQYCTGLTSINIHTGVTSIGESAFTLCSGLTSVIIPNSVTDIGKATFLGCTNLCSVTIGSGVTSIGPGAFLECDNLTSVTALMPTPVEITENTFTNRINAMLYVLKGSISLYANADYWKEFKNILEISKKPIDFADENVKALCVANWDTDQDGELSYEEAAAVTDLGEVFKDNTNITSFDELQYFTGLYNIGDNAFYGCSSLTSVTFPYNLPYIGESAFYGCSGLTSVILPYRMTSIGYYAFRECSNLTSVTSLRATPTKLDASVFSNAANATLYVPKGSKSAYESTDHWNKFNRIVELSDIVFADENVKALCLANWDTDSNGELSYEEAEAVTDLGEVFKDNTDIISFDELLYFTGLTTVRNHAFYGCTSLRNVTYPTSVTSIGDYAFYGCSSLRYGTVPKGVTSIGKSAFEDCKKLTSVTIGSTVTNIGQDAYKSCSSLTSVTFFGNSVISIGNNAFDGCSNLKTVTIPNSVTSIGEKAFYSCQSLTSVSLGKGITSIGVGAFDGCNRLTSVTASMPTPVKISSSTFSNRKNATLRVQIGSRSSYASAAYWKEFKSIVESIIFADENVKALCVAQWDKNNDRELSSGEAAAVTDLGKVFTNKTDITSFDELQYFTGLTSIGTQAFYGCQSLTSVTIPNSVTSIGEAAFRGCQSLTSVTIPDRVTSIGISAFYICRSLTSVTIPDRVKSIGQTAFANCSGLTSVTIGSKVTSIGSVAFGNCTSLKRVYCYAESVPSTQTNAFSSTDIQSATLYVPASALEAYKTTAPWRNFWKIVPLGSVPTGLMEVASVPVQVKSRDGIITVEGLDNNTPVTVYTAGGALVGTAIAVNHTATIPTRLMPGTVAIVKMGGKKVKMVVR